MAEIAQRFANAVQRHRAGRLSEAEALYREILTEEPRHSHALHLLGVLVHQTGRHLEAIDLISRALAAHGPEADWHSNLAAAYLAGGRFIEAAAHCREAIRLKPKHADAHHNLGVALRGQGNLEEAETELRQAVHLAPDLIEARCNLGAVLHRLGKLPEALDQLEETVRLAPGHSQAQHDLGGVLLACGQPEQAMVHLREAIRLRPDFASAYCNLGVALEELNQFDDAVPCFREALRIDPAYASAHNNLGSALQFQGKRDEGLAEFLEALRLEPNNAIVINNLSRLAGVGHFRFSQEQIKNLKELADRGSLPLDPLCRLHFTLAKILDRAEKPEEAFAYCRRGNDLRRELCRRRGVAFDPDAHHQHVDRLIATFSAEYFERARSLGVDSELPIFIVGMPRSGTTLAEQILSSHPQVFGAGELDDLDKISQSLPERLGVADSYPACMTRLDQATARALAEGHLQKLQQLGGPAVRVVDKMPFNFLHLGTIASLFPRARIIHCRRDPLDICLSCYFLNFATRHPFALDLGHLGLYYREHDRLMAHWAKVLPMPTFQLDYEELTADQEKVSRRMIDFCGVPWDDRCLRFFDTQRVVRTPSTLEVRQPMYRTSVGRWKRYEAQLQPLLELLSPQVK